MVAHCRPMQDNRPAAPGLQDHPGRHRNGRKDQRQKLRMLGNGDATAKEMKRIIREHLILPAGLLLYRRTPFWLVKPGNPIEQAPSCACPICGFPPRCRRLEPYRGRWRNRFMLVVMQSHATEQQVRAVCQRIESLGLKAHPIPGSLRTAIGITGNKGEIDLGVLESLPGVVECIPVSKPYKLVSRDAKEEDTILRIPTPSGDVIVGGRHVALVAGPCAVETEEQRLAIAERVMSATLDEFLMAAEYLLSEGNYSVMLCERGVRTFSDFSRNTLDLAVVPAVIKRSHLPIFVDPSHGTGKRHKVLPLSRAALAVGADGLLIEVHHEPDKALSDGMQSLLPVEFIALAEEMRQIAAVLHRSIN